MLWKGVRMYGKTRSIAAFLTGVLLMCGAACITPAYAQETENASTVTYNNETALTENAAERTEAASSFEQSDDTVLADSAVEVQEETQLSEQIEEETTTQTRVVSWESGQDVTDRVGAATETPAADGNVIVVLDPGHDATHGGAYANGLREDELNLSIALYCREALSQYYGVTVYMTRETEDCPYPGTSAGDDNMNRVDYAKRVGADVYVALHCNSATATSANGFEIYYPNRNYDALISSDGMALAQELEKELASLGLYDRGVKVRSSEDNTLYPDGSLADYYGVIKRAKLNGFPGLIVEHAFLTNAGDAAFLSDDANRKKLGEADAEAIAAYFGLSKEAQPTETARPVETARPTETARPVETQSPDGYDYGDVNLDGAVAAEDALLALRHTVGLITIEDALRFSIADMNRDGAIGADDALEILRTVVGLIPEKRYIPSSEEPAAEEPAT